MSRVAPALSLAESSPQKPAFRHAVYPSLRRKRVVVTGGGSGIGAAIVAAFARQGALVSYLDICVDESCALERSLSTLDCPPRFHACDLRDQTAKAGIEGMTRAMARELGEHGIRVTCVVPGGVRTPRQTRLWHTPDEEARILAQQCLKARVEPEDVASLVLFLASDDARMCTAHEYFVDAGWR